MCYNIFEILNVIREIYMSVLTTIEKNFNYLYTKQNELDKLLAKVNLSIREQWQEDI